TLIEMLVVLAVITLLLMLIVPNLGTQNETINQKGEEALIKMTDNHIQAYYIDKGEYPENIQDLIVAEYLSSDELPGGNRVLILTTDEPPKADVINNGE